MGLRRCAVAASAMDAGKLCRVLEALGYAHVLTARDGEAALSLVRANWDLRRPIRMLTVTALEVSGADEPEQLSMFEAAAPRKSDEKRERLERSLDAIRRKYGKNSIAAADVLKNDIGLEGIEMEQSAPGEEGETE